MDLGTGLLGLVAGSETHCFEGVGRMLGMPAAWTLGG